MDSSLNVITEVKALMPLDNTGNILTYSRELSDFGTCKFRISTADRVWTDYGDIFEPHKYHVRLRKGTTTIWQGAIIDNPKRNKDYIEILAAEYEFYLSKNLIKRTSADVNGNTNILRIFKSGTMSTAVTAIINETITDYSSPHIMSTMTVGTIENPNYPSGLTSGYDKSVLSGAWSFGDSSSTAKGPTLQFDFHDALYVMKVFGMYTYADFEIDSDMHFNFKRFLGNKKQNEITFSYGEQGNIIDYNCPRLGQRMMNKVVAIATDGYGVILHEDVECSESIASVKEYGPLEGVAAYNDVTDANLLKLRAKSELPFVAKPDDSNITLYLNEHGYPLGMYDVGDLVTVKIKDSGINVDQIRRIVGYTVIQNNTGRETIALQTNKPFSWQYT